MADHNQDEARKNAFKALITGGEAVIRRLKGMESHAQETNDALLREILHKNARSEYGTRYGFASIKSYEEFAAKVPLTDYSDYEPYIERMSERGENNVLTCAKVNFYFSTAGTTGVSKHIPTSREQDKVIMTYTNLYRYGMIAGSLGDIWTDGATMSPIEVRFGKTGSGVPTGCFSAKLFSDLGDMVDYASLSPRAAVYSEPGEDTQYLHLLFALKRSDVTEMDASYVTWLLEMMRRLEQQWEELVQSIREGSLPQSLNLSPERQGEVLESLRPDPERADLLEQEFRRGFDDPIIPRIWKNFALVDAACGGSFAPYMQQFRRYIGDDTAFYCHGYTASEGVIGAPVALNSTQMVFLPDSCFYEFQPFDETAQAASGDESGEPPILRMDQLEAGRTYLVIITNRVGLYRYRMHDVIRVVGFRQSLPVFEMLYRDNALKSIAGEKVSEEEISRAVFQTMAEQDIKMNGFSCYSDPDAKPGAGYVFLIEPEEDGPLPDRDMLGGRIMDLLEEKNVNLKKVRDLGVSIFPIVKYLKKGTYKNYRAMKGDQGLGGNQIKPPQILRTAELVGFFLKNVR